MTLMMGKLYAALKAANAPETEAREAAEEAASVHNRLDELDRGLAGINAAIDLLRTELKGEIAALSWLPACWQSPLRSPANCS